MKKYRMDQKNYNFILSKIFDDFSICPNCQAPESQCLNRQEVTLR